MFLDASAMVAILLREPEAAELSERLEGASRRLTSALAIYETTLAVTRRRGWTLPAARGLVAEFMDIVEISIVPIDASESQAALDAFERYGKGRHPAALNMGDCFAYACAKTHRVPLLFKGDDFSKTDVVPA